MPTGEVERTLDATRPRGLLRWWAVGGAIVLVLVLVGISSRAQPNDEASQVAAGPTAEELATARAVLEEQMAAGFVPYRDDDPYVGEPVTGWLPVGTAEQPLGQDYDRDEHRVPVYSTTDPSTRIGFDYTYIGFVPLSVAESGTFDAPAVRREAFGGCDPLAPDEDPEPCPVSRWTKPHGPEPGAPDPGGG